jgi:hypothetical protein
MLAGAVLLAGTFGSSPAPGRGPVVARLGSITVTATSMTPGPSGTLSADVQVSTTAPASDQLDAALAGSDTAVDVYHHQVSVGEIPDLASCDSELPPPGVVDRWLHYGPLVVPGRSSGAAPPARATLTVPAASRLPTHPDVSITLYFAHAGQITVDIPVRSA